MNPLSRVFWTPVVNPILSLRTASVLLLATIAAAFVDRLSEGNLLPNAIAVGGLYGIISGWVWVTSSVEHRLIRLTIRMTLVGLGSYGILYLTENPERIWLKYVTQFGGMVVTQSVLFYFLRIPEWRLGFREANVVTDPSPGNRAQFDIADVMLVTIAIAVLLGLAIRYRTPIESSDYWAGVFGLWIFFPLLAALSAICTIPSQNGSRVGQFVSLIALGISGAWVMAKAQMMTSENAWGDELFFFNRYGSIMLGFVFAILIFGIVGRKNPLIQDIARKPDSSTGL